MRFKTLKKVFLWIVAIAAFLALSLFLAQRYLEPEIQKLFVAEINKSLTAQVQVENIRFSLIKDFPSASVRFTGVRMKEAIKDPSKTYLLKAGTISFQFNIWDLLRKRYKIKHIRFADVELNPRVYADYSDNFHCWKAEQGTGSNFSFEVQRVVINRLHLNVKNEATHTSIDAELPDFTAKGNFSSSKYMLELAGEVLLHEHKTQDICYITERRINLALSLAADNNTGSYQIMKGSVETGKLKLAASGNLIYSGQQHLINLDITATGSTLEEMLSLVPATFTKQLDKYRFEGRGNVVAKIAGQFGRSFVPAVNLRLDLQNGLVTERSTGVCLKGISAIAEYSTKQDGKEETLSVSNLNARLGDGLLSGSLVMTGFTSPQIQCNFNASLSLEELHRFFEAEEITAMSGWLKVNAAFDGKIAELHHPTSTDFINSNLTGQGNIEKASVALKDYNLPLEEITADFSFNGSDLQLQQVGFRVSKSDFNLHGTLGNLLSWIFIKDENLMVSGSLLSKRFDWDELSAAQYGTSEEFRFGLPAEIAVSDLHLRCNNFSFRKFSATDISGLINLRHKVLSVSEVEMFTNQGKVKGQININAQSEKYSLLQAKGYLEKVNINTLFTQFGNFGQDDLKADNLEGLITADLIFAGQMQSNLDIDLNSLKVHSDITIENGRLVNYSPMQSLSKYLKVEDLADIRFATLQNQIDIANQVIYIPSMQIKSSVLDLQLMGTHTFDNELEYHFTLALADLVAAKFKKRNAGYNNQAEFGQMEDDGRGRTKIFVSLTGTVDNPIVKYDKKAMREKIANDLKSQKTELKQAFKQELRLMQGDTLKKAERLKEKETIKKQERGEFIIEWDDDKK